MRILILQDDFPPRVRGGAGIVACRLAQEFSQMGNDVEVVTTVRDRGDIGVKSIGLIRVHALYSKYHDRWRAFRSINNPKLIDGVKKIIKKFRPDVIHVHNIHQHLSYKCLKVAKDSGAKVFLTAHDTMLYSYGKVVNEKKISEWENLKRNQLRFNPFRNAMIRHYLQYVDEIVAVSNILKTALNNNEIKNVSVIYNGIDIDQWHVPDAEVDEFKRRYSLESKKIILFAGRWSGPKGGKLLVRAFSKVRDKVDNAMLLIIGGGDSNIEKEKDIVVINWIDSLKMPVVYNASNVVVFPSVYLDPFGLIHIEAMASKKPVIGTTYGGSQEIVEDGVTGFIINPNNTDELSDKIITILSNEDLARKFGDAGYDLAKRKFTLKEQANQYLNKFKE